MIDTNIYQRNDFYVKRNNHDTESKIKNVDLSDKRFRPVSFGFVESCNLLMRHTMQQALIPFIDTKIPRNSIVDKMGNDYDIHIFGIHSDESNIKTLRESGYNNVELLKFKEDKGRKKANFIRPRFYEAKINDKNVLVSIVSPGLSYLEQYSKLINFALKGIYPTKGDVKVLHSEEYYKSFIDSIGLDKKTIKVNDRVILGHSDHFSDYLESKDYKETYNFKNEFISSIRYKINNKENINLLGVNFSFWGDMSGKISEKLLSLGAKEIIYFSKVGSMDKDNPLYKTIYTPNNFIQMTNENVNCVFSQKNNLSGVYDNFVSSTHVSVPTVMDETYEQKDKATSLGAKTIDNEVAYIAKTIHDHNKIEGNSIVGFSAINFTTDYLYSKDENFDHSRPNLSTCSHSEERENKKLTYEVISSAILEHLKGSNDESR